MRFSSSRGGGDQTIIMQKLSSSGGEGDQKTTVEEKNLCPNDKINIIDVNDDEIVDVDTKINEINNENIKSENKLTN